MSFVDEVVAGEVVAGMDSVRDAAVCVRFVARSSSFAVDALTAAGDDAVVEAGVEDGVVAVALVVVVAGVVVTGAGITPAAWPSASATCTGFSVLVDDPVL